MSMRQGDVYIETIRLLLFSRTSVFCICSFQNTAHATLFCHRTQSDVANILFNMYVYNIPTHRLVTIRKFGVLSAINSATVISIRLGLHGLRTRRYLSNSTVVETSLLRFKSLHLLLTRAVKRILPTPLGRHLKPHGAQDSLIIKIIVTFLRYFMN
jgi:hypothetical protein